MTLRGETFSGLSLAEARRRAAALLAESGIEEASLDARLLVEHATGTDPALPGAAALRPVEEPQAQRLAGLIERRLAREPVCRILGRAEFHGLPLVLNAACLIPRSDTEALVEAALDLLPADRPAAVLDLGTGPGTVLLAILGERPLARGTGIDIAADALDAARANAGAAGLAARAAFRQGTWTAGLDGTFDLIVSNPPYIPSAECARLSPEVARHDPRVALDGGPDGLDAYRAIFADAPRLLAPGGAVAVEIGIGQAGDAARLARAAGLVLKRLRSDLAGIPRALVFAIA